MPISLLVGATGQIGRQMLQRLGRRALATTRAADPPLGWLPLDLASLATSTDAELTLRQVELDAIYCIAGMTNVEACEDQQELAFRVNAQAPAALATIACRRNIPFVYYSTEYIFDGEDGPYREEQQANPISVYGRSKLAGEIAVLTAHPGALILRTTVVYGPDAAQKNFLYSLMRNLKAGQSMRVPEDQVSTPTYNLDLAVATEELVARRASGVFNVCGPELLSRLEFATRIAVELGLDASLILGLPTVSLGQRAPRPLRAGLCTNKLRREHPDLLMRTLSESMVDCRPTIQQFLIAD